jgi:hypothetical protein
MPFSMREVDIAFGCFRQNAFLQHGFASFLQHGFAKGPVHRGVGVGISADGSTLQTDASVTIRPLILILAQRVKPNMSCDGCFRQNAFLQHGFASPLES